MEEINDQLIFENKTLTMSQLAANQTSKVKINLKKNVVNVDFHVAQYAKIVEDLRAEIVTLKEKIKALEVENEAMKRVQRSCIAVRVSGFPPLKPDPKLSAIGLWSTRHWTLLPSTI